MITVYQMVKWIRRCNPKHDPRVVARALAKRIENGPARSCIPKKKLRAAGLLPPGGWKEVTKADVLGKPCNPCKSDR